LEGTAACPVGGACLAATMRRELPAIAIRSARLKRATAAKSITHP
jgi:hypothetical protein